MTNPWGEKETEYFYQLTPDRVLNAIEASLGVRCTGRAFALNSMENRVYEIEIELDHKPRNRSENFVIAKFYRPGRWSIEQIQDEHDFMNDLVAHEIPVIAPLPFEDGRTIHSMADDAPEKETNINILYSVFRKQGGRSPDELMGPDLEIIGRLLARIHAVGASRRADHRIRLDVNNYGRANLRFLVDQNLLPLEIKTPYCEAVETICSRLESRLEQVTYQRVHGDCHFGNLLHGQDGFFFVDFDDMVMGPPVQDIWLLTPGRDPQTDQDRQTLLAAYESMHTFDRSSLDLIEGLRALRFIHFAAWIGKRWQDPAFKRAFPVYGEMRYWQEQLQDLREQLLYIS